jgi:hypothetical protein
LGVESGIFGLQTLEGSKITADMRTSRKLLKIIILSSASPRQVARIIVRIRRDAPEAQVCGLLYEQPRPKTLKQRIVTCGKKMTCFVYWRYLVHRLFAAVNRQASGFLDMVIRFIHAAPRRPNGNRSYGLADLGETCKAIGAELLVTLDIHSDEAVDFARRMNADLGLVLGTRILKPALYNIPQQGSINIHKRKVPDYRGGGAVGLWELLDDQKEIGVTVHRVEAQVDAGGVIRSALIPIEPFDDLESLALKADVVGDDLIVAAISDFARGTVVETPQRGPSKLFRNPAPEDLLRLEKQLAAARRENYGHPHLRPPWKLLIKSLLFLVPAILRNWRYRRKKDFPVMILYHHLISDRPHHLGVSTACFLRQVNYLLRHYRVVSLREAVELARKGGVDVPTVAITFDDGYADNFVNLRAVTEETGIPIAYFIVSEHMSTGREFRHDEEANEHGFLPNTWEQIAFLKHNGYEIGSHTRTHANCGSTDPEFLRREIVGAGEDIEKRLGRTSNFAFPFGKPPNISALAMEIACGAYENVFSTNGGGNFHREHARMLTRSGFTRTLWELELQLQRVLGRLEKEDPHLKIRVDYS